MSDEKALLAVIWEHPHEDTPRLMYADWLDEHNQAPRAEFIRAQCERARLDPWDDADRVAALVAREAVLWKPNVKGWKAPLPKALQNAPFRRGFVYPRPLGFGGSKFVKLKPDALDAAPQWTATLRTLGRHFAKAFASPLLLRFNELAIERASYSGDLLAELAGNERLRNVTDLFVVSDNRPPESVTAFYSGPATANLSRLFAGNLDPEAFGALAASPVAGRLKYLAFWLMEADDLAGWAACHLSAAHFPRLRALRLFYSGPIGNVTSAVRLLTAAPAARLARIEMNWCRVDDDGAEELAAWPGLAAVRELELEFNDIGERGFRALVRSPFASGLTLLKLDKRSLDDIPNVKAELDARFGPAVRYR